MTSTEDRQTDRHTDRRTFFIIHFFGLLGSQNVKIRQNLEVDILLRDNTFPIGKVKKNKIKRLSFGSFYTYIFILFLRDFRFSWYLGE